MIENSAPIVVDTAHEAERWPSGDMFGIAIPADIETLIAGGEAFLTKAFQTSGALAASNQVSRITQAEACFGGGTGSKMMLAVEYERAAPNLPQQLFVKFSRNFNDPMRDRSRHMMVSEVKFAALSRTPGFPITVPECLFADMNAQSGTGLIITERLAFGSDGLEPLYEKCMDYAVAKPLEHYQAVIKALARLSGTHRAGGLHADFDKAFAFDREAVLNADSLRYNEEKLLRRASRIGEFIRINPQLFPDNLHDPVFHQQFLQEVPEVIAVDEQIKQILYSNSDLIALCHWNANIDNGWYWRDSDGALQCGLMDWGRVGQITVAQAIYGSFSGAEKPLWDNHLEDIVALFVTEYAAQGGPKLDAAELKLHTLLVTATMGLAYLMDAPAIIERQIPDLKAVTGPQDEIFSIKEDARVQLHMLTMFLNQWQTRNIGELVKQLINQ